MKRILIAIVLLGIMHVTPAQNMLGVDDNILPNWILEKSKVMAKIRDYGISIYPDGSIDLPFQDVSDLSMALTWRGVEDIDRYAQMLWKDPERTPIHTVSNDVFLRVERMPNNIAYIMMRDTPKGVASACRIYLERLIESGGKFQGLVLDLRDNSGGSVDDLEKILQFFWQGKRRVGYFIDRGIKRGARAAPNAWVRKTVTVKGHGLLAGVPVVILVNGATASSAEIISAVLQEQGIGIVLSRESRTYGKGVIRHAFRISDEWTLKITVRIFTLLDGTLIQGHGVKPDIMIVGGIHVSEQHRKKAVSPRVMKALMLLRELGDLTEEELEVSPVEEIQARDSTLYTAWEYASRLFTIRQFFTKME